MNHTEKVSLVLDELAAKGMSRSQSAPPLFRCLRRLGVPIPPPHFLSFFSLAFFMGSFFGLAWGLLMWLAYWSWGGLSARMAFGLSVLAGTLFGVAMATYYRWSARRLGLSTWSAYEKKG